MTIQLWESASLKKRKRQATERLVLCVGDGQSAIKENKNVSFINLNEIKGMDEAIKDLHELATTFKDKRHQFANLGVEKINRNLLIVGQQGSGKSNLAYSFANEMGLPTKVIHGRDLIT